MIKIFLCLLFLIFSLSLSAQLNEAYLYGTSNLTEVGKSFCRTTDGGFLITGEQVDSSIFPLRTTFVFKIDSLGQMEWTKRLWTNRNTISDIIQTPDHNYLITGSGFFDSTQNLDVYLIKMSQSGSIIWSTSFGSEKDDGGYLIRTTLDGGFIIGGYTMISTGLFSAHGVVYVVKTDSSGNVQWANSYDGGVNDYFRDLVIDSAGGYFLTGYTLDSVFMDVRAFYMRIDSAGNIDWSRRLTGLSVGSACKLLSNGNILLAGRVNPPGVFLFELDQNLHIVRAKGVSHGGAVLQIIQSPDDGFLLALLDGFKLNLEKVDSSLNFLWRHAFQKNALGDGRLAYNMVRVSDSLYAILSTANLRQDDVLFRYVSESITPCDSAVPVTNVFPDTMSINMNFIVRTGITRIPIMFRDSTLMFEFNTVCGNNFTTGISASVSESNFEVYPVPFVDEVTFRVSQPGQLQIFDMSSKLVKETSINTDEIILELEFLKYGFYFAKFITGNGVSFRKILKVN